MAQGKFWGCTSNLDHTNTVQRSKEQRRKGGSSLGIPGKDRQRQLRELREIVPASIALFGEDAVLRDWS